jgi:hypothetical protein
MTRIRDEESIDSHVRSSLHKLGCRSVEKFTTITGTVIWSCGKFTVFLWRDDQSIGRMSDEELSAWVAETLRHRIEKGIA